MRGDGDCEGGCINNEYFYFETDPTCLPSLRGHHSRTYDGARNCFVYEGTALWGFPGAPPPSGDCGADPTPQDISGTYELTGEGLELPCSVDGQGQRKVTRAIQLVVEDYAPDPTMAVVFISGSGNVSLEGQELRGTIVGSTLTVENKVLYYGACFDSNSLLISVSYDFASRAGRLHLEEVTSLECRLDVYCKGSLDLSLHP